MLPQNLILVEDLPPSDNDDEESNADDNEEVVFVSRHLLVSSIYYWHFIPVFVFCHDLYKKQPWMPSFPFLPDHFLAHSLASSSIDNMFPTSACD